MSSPEAAAPPAKSDFPYPHLLAGVVAWAVVAGVMGTAMLMGRARVRSHIAALALSQASNEWQGQAIQRETFRRPDLLPLYGSSELTVPMPNRALEFFASRPTGFAVAPFGHDGSPLLAILLRIGGLGEAIRGRKLAISVSATWFLKDRLAERAAIEADFSVLHAGDLMFRTQLPDDLKGRMAARLLEFRGNVEEEPLLLAALSCVAEHCGLERYLPVLAPFWSVRSFPLRAWDYFHAGAPIRGVPPSPPRALQFVHFDWPALFAAADSDWRARSIGNPFGIDRAVWDGLRARGLPSPSPAGRKNQEFLRGVARATSWEDLDLLLAMLRQLGARALLLNIPLKGPYFDYLGVSPGTRERLYNRFSSVTEPYGFTVRDFREYDGDPNFLRDPGTHPSLKGWLIINRTIDAFYHDSIR